MMGKKQDVRPSPASAAAGLGVARSDLPAPKSLTLNQQAFLNVSPSDPSSASKLKGGRWSKEEDDQLRVSNSCVYALSYQNDYVGNFCRFQNQNICDFYFIEGGSGLPAVF
jgi:hypothetical protein